MPPRSWRLCIEDILEAVRKIDRYTAGMTPEAFFSEPQIVDAVAYNFIIVGEAARALPTEIETRYPQIPWKEMRDMRNFLVHQYPGVDPDIVWQTLMNDLPPLALQLERILAQEDAP